MFERTWDDIEDTWENDGGFQPPEIEISDISGLLKAWDTWNIHPKRVRDYVYDAPMLALIPKYPPFNGRSIPLRYGGTK